MSFTSADTPSVAGSSILRQSPPFLSQSHTGPGGADLSLSELYISDRNDDSPAATRPFSLLPERNGGIEEERSFFSDSGGVVEEEDEEATIHKRRDSAGEARQREERLQRDLFVLKKLNASFSLYNEALKDARSSTEVIYYFRTSHFSSTLMVTNTQNVALQLDRTDRLLDQYVELLQHTERNSKLIFDEAWEGGTTVGGLFPFFMVQTEDAQDLELLEQLRIEKEEKAKRAREERERLARLEEEQRQKEEEERRLKEERETREKLKGITATRGARGVRPTRGTERG